VTTDLTPLEDDDASLDAEERRLLRAGRGMGVPRGAKRAVLLGLAAQLPGIAAATTTTTSVLTAASLAKYGAVGVLLGATTMTTVTVMRSPASPSSSAAPKAAPAAPARAPEAVEAPRAAEPATDDAPVAPDPVPVVTERPAAPSAVTATPVAPAVPPALDTEARRVAAARALTRAGRPREALASLDAIARDLPNGELVQEREALAIEALLTLGERAEARRRAASFLQRFPGSPHSAAARRALE
jgi:hypothetical protein